MVQSLCHRQICVLQCHVLAPQTNGHVLVGTLLPFGHGSPFGEVGFPILQTQVVADAVCQTFVLQHHGHFVQGRCRHVLDNVFFPYITEHADLPLHILRNLQLCPADYHVGLNADRQQFLDGVLCGLGFQFIGAGNIRHQCHVNVHGIASAHFGDELTNRFQKRCALDVAYGTADLCDDNICVGFLADTIDAVLDLVGDVRDHLHSAAQIVAAAFLVQNGPVHFTGGNIVVDRQALVDETLVVTEIQIGFCTVVRYEYFTVLVRAHGTRIHVDIRVKFLDRDLIAAGFQQTTQRSRGDSLTQSGHNAAGDKYIFWHI